ncbi:hypothetical protein ABZX92_45540, partial [Lentzea sp. NPDC006480]
AIATEVAQGLNLQLDEQTGTVTVEQRLLAWTGGGVFSGADNRLRQVRETLVTALTTALTSTPDQDRSVIPGHAHAAEWIARALVGSFTTTDIPAGTPAEVVWVARLRTPYRFTRSSMTDQVIVVPNPTLRLRSGEARSWDVILPWAQSWDTLGLPHPQLSPITEALRTPPARTRHGARPHRRAEVIGYGPAGLAHARLVAQGLQESLTSPDDQPRPARVHVIASRATRPGPAPAAHSTGQWEHRRVRIVLQGQPTNPNTHNPAPPRPSRPTSPPPQPVIDIDILATRDPNPPPPATPPHTPTLPQTGPADTHDADPATDDWTDLFGDENAPNSTTTANANPPNPDTPHFSTPDPDAPDFSGPDFSALDFGALDPDALDFGAPDPSLSDFSMLDFTASDPGLPNTGTDSATPESMQTREWPLSDTGPSDPMLDHHRSDPAFGLPPLPGFPTEQDTADSPRNQARNLLNQHRVPEHLANQWTDVVARLISQGDNDAATAIAYMLMTHPPNGHAHSMP